MNTSEKPIGVGIIGLGTVGQGAYSILRDNAEIIQRQVGRPVRVRCVADVRADSLEDTIDPDVRLVNDAGALLEDPNVDIVCEIIGGVTPAGDFVRNALRHGKHVVTANKELVAKHGPELLQLADQHNADFYFEASVGGGIPIIAPLRSQLAGNRVDGIIGIVNGTTNYILTVMSAQGLDMPSVLQEAQELGYAEQDPTNDVEGYDARYKLTILASLGFGARVSVDQIPCEGITALQPQDVEYASELGYEIKLLAIGKRINGRLELRVHPALVPYSHPIASVSGVNNAIYVTGNAVGDVMFFGPGAGGMAAGSAIVGDVIEVARNIVSGTNGRLRAQPFADVEIVKPEDIVARYYIRMLVQDAPGVLAAISSEFGQQQVSLAAVLQKDTSDGVAELIFLTHEVREGALTDALGRIADLEQVEEVCSFVRVEE